MQQYAVKSSAVEKDSILKEFWVQSVVVANMLYHYVIEQFHNFLHTFPKW